jgi:hypothetical protein
VIRSPLSDLYLLEMSTTYVTIEADKTMNRVMGSLVPTPVAPSEPAAVKPNPPPVAPSEPAAVKPNPPPVALPAVAKPALPREAYRNVDQIGSDPQLGREPRLSHRTIKSLHSHGIRQIQDVRRFSAEDLRKILWVGEGSIWSLRRTLGMLGLALLYEKPYRDGGPILKIDVEREEK